MTSSRVRRGQLVLDRARRARPSGPSSVGTIVTFGPRSVCSISMRPAISASVAAPFGFRASKISTTRGRPCVMSAPATPPVWNVRIVSCVPGSPIDCAAMMPTASPISDMLARGEEDAVAGLAHAGLGAALEHRPDRDRRVRAELGLELLEQRRPSRSSPRLGHRRLARLAGRERLVDVVADEPAEQGLVQPLARADRRARGSPRCRSRPRGRSRPARRRRDAASGSPSRPCAARCRRGPCGRRGSR